MSQRPIEQLTLRELLISAEMLIRELSEHLELSFQPRIRAGEETVRGYERASEREEVADSTVRSRTAALLTSDDFSQQLLGRLEQHLAAIGERAEKAIQER
ncbi:MAG: hypothetical protein ACT4QC_24170 [Planctomycetaceae bacterium]